MHFLYSNHRRLDGLLNRLFRRGSKKTFKLCVTGLCEGNSPVTGQFFGQRPVTRCLDVFFDLCLNKRFSKQCWGWRFKTPSRSLWRHCNRSVWIDNREKNSTTKLSTFVRYDVFIRLDQEPHTPVPIHDDVIKWKHFPRNWPFVRGIHRSRWIPHTKASDAELWCLLWSASE